MLVPAPGHPPLDPSLAGEAPWLLGLSQTLWEITRGDGQEVTFRAPSPRLPTLTSERKCLLQTKSRGTFMSRRMIWAEDERLTGWCCSQCSWGLTAPRLESTLAALAFKRVAQDR